MSGSGIPVRVPELAIDRDHRNDDPALSRRERPDPGDLQKIQDAWSKSMLLHLALWARPYVADCPWKAAARTQRKNVLKGWWRRRESNPRPKPLSAERLHAQSSSKVSLPALRTDKKRRKLVR